MINDAAPIDIRYTKRTTDALPTLRKKFARFLKDPKFVSRLESEISMFSLMFYFYHFVDSKNL